MGHKGMIAAGHPATVEAGSLVLREGGNAFDAAIAALCAAFVAEPVLASPGGGGFLLVHRGRQHGVYDFFAHTPRAAKSQPQIDFHPIQADFGSTTQEFHIGLGAAATPGTVRGLFEVHRDLGSVPMRRLVEPALALARDGVIWNEFQSHVFDVIGPIYQARPESARHYGSPGSPGQLLRAGDRYRAPELADLLESLAMEGDRLFYDGEIARAIVQACDTEGGHLTLADFAHYTVARRSPLQVDYRGHRLVTNPPPSCGGILIAFALALLEAVTLADSARGSARHLRLLAEVMNATNRARVESGLRDLAPDRQESVLLGGDLLARYRKQVLGRAASLRGTTHISVIDEHGDAASLTVSNGEGCGYLVPGAGFMLNNMLGEEDINPHGFHRWPVDTRMASMMSPSLLLAPGGAVTALGSGGSNRIRTAIIQVISNLVDFRMSVEAAVEAPRIHHEADQLDVEGGYSEAVYRQLAKDFPQHRFWSDRSLFFGGAHCVRSDPGKRAFEAAGDPRRGGASRLLGA